MDNNILWALKKHPVVLLKCALIIKGTHYTGHIKELQDYLDNWAEQELIFAKSQSN